MTLPYDYARCRGKGLPECGECQRRTSPWGPYQPVVTPPSGDGCELYIAPDRYTITAKGRAILEGK